MTIENSFPETIFFIQKSLNETIKIYGGNADEWVPSLPLRENYRKRTELRMYLVKVDDIKIEYVESVYYYKNDNKTTGEYLLKHYHPFKNIQKIELSLPGVLILYNPVKSLKFVFDEGCNYIIDEIIEKYNKFYEIEHNETIFSKADEIKKFKELLDDGTITEDEFKTFKQELLE